MIFLGFDCLASSSILIKVDAVSRCGCDYKELVNEEEDLLTDFQGYYESALPMSIVWTKFLSF